MKAFLIPLHFTFMISGVVLLLVAAVLAFLKKEGWFKLHKVLALLGSLSAFTAFALIFLLKYKMHYPHFTSLHGIGGLTSVSLLAIVLISGFLMVKGNKPARPVHIWMGRITALILSGAIVSGILRFVEIFSR